MASGSCRIGLDADDHSPILAEVLDSVALVGGELFADRLELAWSKARCLPARARYLLTKAGVISRILPRCSSVSPSLSAAVRSRSATDCATVARTIRPSMECLAFSRCSGVSSPAMVLSSASTRSRRPPGSPGTSRRRGRACRDLLPLFGRQSDLLGLLPGPAPSAYHGAEKPPANLACALFLVASLRSSTNPFTRSRCSGVSTSRMASSSDWSNSRR